jgi:hypothetical protein
MWFFEVKFFVVAVFLWSNRAIIRTNMHPEATRSPQLSLRGGFKVEKNMLITNSLIFYEKY